MRQFFSSRVPSNRLLTLTLVGMIAILAASALPAQSLGPAGYTLELLNIPSNALARDMNAQGQIVGDFIDVWGGYIYQNGITEYVDYPGAEGSYLASINDQGTVFGTYVPDTSGPQRYGFSRDKQGNFTDIIYPGSDTTRLNGGNNKGDVVGYIEVPGFILPGGLTYQGFVRNAQGIFTDLSPPGSFLTLPIGVNEKGLVSGFFLSDVDFAFHGFTYSNGVYTVVDYPGAVGSELIRTNDKGDTIGEYSFTSPTLDDWTPYLRTDSGALQDLSYPDPNAVLTQASAITNRGDICATAILIDATGAPYTQSFIWRK